LVGGSSSNEGNVFATNPTTGYYGPVCDDFWAIEEVRILFFTFIKIVINNAECFHLALHLLAIRKINSYCFA
jgi:hypothetical protein